MAQHSGLLVKDDGVLQVAEKLLTSVPGFSAALEVALQLGDEVGVLTHSHAMVKEELRLAEAKLKDQEGVAKELKKLKTKAREMNSRLAQVTQDNKIALDAKKLEI